MENSVHTCFCGLLFSLPTHLLLSAHYCLCDIFTLSPLSVTACLIRQNPGQNLNWWPEYSHFQVGCDRNKVKNILLGMAFVGKKLG